MNILLTNDDGYLSSGIIKLKKVLEKYGTVYMIAPKSIQSGKGCAITNYMGTPFEKIDEYNYIIDGTPVDCVCFAQSVLSNINFDLVVSGCNDGYNISLDVMYSGTCGACIQAGLSNLKAIAFSCICNANFDQIDMYAPMVLDYIFKNDLLSTEFFLNVNFHNPEFENPKGILLTKLLNYRCDYWKEIDGNIFKARRTKIFDASDDISNDCGAIRNGYISITPLTFNTFDNLVYEKVKNGLQKNK